MARWRLVLGRFAQDGLPDALDPDASPAYDRQMADR